jgi:hypothetical protein
MNYQLHVQSVSQLLHFYNFVSDSEKINQFINLIQMKKGRTKPNTKLDKGVFLLEACLA